MSAARELLLELQLLGVSLTAGGDRLRVKAPPGVVTVALRERLAAQKAELLRLLEPGEATEPARPPHVWRASIDGKVAWIIDTEHTDRTEQARRLGLKFGPHRVVGLALVSGGEINQQRKESGNGE